MWHRNIFCTLKIHSFCLLKQICSCVCTLGTIEPGWHSPPSWLFTTVLLPFGTGSGCYDNITQRWQSNRNRQVCLNLLAFGRGICLVVGSHSLPKNRRKPNNSRCELCSALDYYISHGLNPQKTSKGYTYEGSRINMCTLITTLFFFLGVITGKWWCC